jgi:hypothetical protein
VESLACGWKGKRFLTIALAKGGLSIPPDKLKRKSVLSPRGQKGFLRVGRKWMIRLGGKFEDVLVSQVKVLHHWRLAPVIRDPDSYTL